MKFDKKLIFLAPLLVLLLSYQNCGKFVAENPEMADFSSLDQSIDYKMENPVALLTFEQILKSMSSLTNVPITPSYAANEKGEAYPVEREVVRVYKLYKSAFAEDFNTSSITAPMLVGITNLAGAFCAEMIEIEKSKNANDRNVFKEFDFTKTLSSQSEKEYLSIINSLSWTFWGRAITREEQSHFLDFRNTFMSDSSAAELNSTKSAQDLLHSVCTPMLASTESYTL